MGGYIIVSALVIITCIILVLVVLVQNPKGGGLSSAFGGSASSNQIMGVKRTANFLEKTTWTLAIILLILSLSSVFVIPRSQTQEKTTSEAKEFFDENPEGVTNIPQGQVMEEQPRQMPEQSSEPEETD
ncbi:MAG: preprotein translocase subunit SecG [Bacteroidales bacterium]